LDTQSEFERGITMRVEKVESAVLELARKVDALASGPARHGPRPAPAAAASEPLPGSPAGGVQPTPGRPKAAPRPHWAIDANRPERGVDWWLARAGAGLTIVAVILLYQYAVGHGWITPWVRVLAGALVGSALMYWGRKMAPSSVDDSTPVALRELMMGSALAVWYITAYAVSARYHLIPLSASRYVFLILSVAGAALSLKERRSGLALLAVTAGFLGPLFLAGPVPEAYEYALYTSVLGALAIVLYLMRGWQSVLWISFFAVSITFSLPVFYSEAVVLTLAGVAVALAYGRAPTLRRSLVATGSERYPEPVRSRFAAHWLSETGRFLKMFSPAAGALDSLSIWAITLAAPIVGISLLSRAWPAVNDAVWGALELTLAIVAYRMCNSASDDNSEITHLEGVASLVWGTFGMIGITQALIIPSFIDHGTLALGIVGLAAILAITLPDTPRYVAAIRTGILMSGLATLVALFNELQLSNLPATLVEPDRIKAALSIAELIAIAAGALGWREMRRRNVGGDAANTLILMCYGALLLVDARVLGEIWRPLVTASFAIAGTLLLFMSRKENSKILRTVGGATLALVVLRLFFVDMRGVDTIWRVLLFLGIGALFLFTSRQLQAARPQTPSEST
jgi:uncharacterized membrane protein